MSIPKSIRLTTSTIASSSRLSYTTSNLIKSSNFLSSNRVNLLSSSLKQQLPRCSCINTIRTLSTQSSSRSSDSFANIPSNLTNNSSKIVSPEFVTTSATLSALARLRKPFSRFLRSPSSRAHSTTATLPSSLSTEPPSSSTLDKTASIEVPLTTPDVAKYLFVIAGMVFTIVVVGGLTRLTESGLSITEWNVVSGILPPLGAADWEVEFAKYRATPEWRIQNQNITLSEFKTIFFWEWSHRILGRMIGLAFLAPIPYFLLRRKLSPRSSASLLGIGTLIGCQGAMGWYMVKSGLDEASVQELGGVPRVSQYRLAAHLGMAFLVYSACLRLALGVGRDFKIVNGGGQGIGAGLGGFKTVEETLMKLKSAPAARVRLMVSVLTGLIFVTAVSGAFVAGLDAGLVYNDFPLMGGRLVPPTEELFSDHYARNPDKKDRYWRNMLENPTTVQFDHRVLAMTTFTSIVALFLYARRPSIAKHLPPTALRLIRGTFHMSLLQVSLGISTLIYLVPVPLAAAHQAGSLVLLSLAIASGAALRRPGRVARELLRRSKPINVVGRSELVRALKATQLQQSPGTSIESIVEDSSNSLIPNSSITQSSTPTTTTTATTSNTHGTSQDGSTSKKDKLKVETELGLDSKSTTTNSNMLAQKPQPVKATTPSTPPYVVSEDRPTSPRYSPPSPIETEEYDQISPITSPSHKKDLTLDATSSLIELFKLPSSYELQSLRVEKLTEEKKTTKQALEEVNSKLEVLSNKYRAKEAKEVELRGRIAARKEEIKKFSDIAKDFEDFKGRLVEATAEILEHQLKEESDGKLLAEKEKVVESLTVEVETLGNQLYSLKKDYKTLKSEFKRKEEYNVSIVTELSVTKDTLSKSLSKTKDLDRTPSDLIEAKPLIDIEFKQSNEELDEYKKQMGRLENEKAALVQEKLHLNEVIQSLQMQYKKAESDYQDSHQKLSKTAVEKDFFAAQVSGLRLQLDDFMEEKLKDGDDETSKMATSKEVEHWKSRALALETEKLGDASLIPELEEALDVVEKEKEESEREKKELDIELKRVEAEWRDSFRKKGEFTTSEKSGSEASLQIESKAKSNSPGPVEKEVAPVTQIKTESMSPIIPSDPDIPAESSPSRV